MSTVQEELTEVKEKIKLVEANLKLVEANLEAIARKQTRTADTHGALYFDGSKDYLQVEKRQLQEEKRQLQEEKLILLKQQGQFKPFLSSNSCFVFAELALAINSFFCVRFALLCLCLGFWHRFANKASSEHGLLQVCLY